MRIRNNVTRGFVVNVLLQNYKPILIAARNMRVETILLLHDMKDRSIVQK